MIPMSGTFTLTSGSAAVAGVGSTLFQNLFAGDTVTFAAAGAIPNWSQAFTITANAPNDTSATLNFTWPNATTSNLTMWVLPTGYSRQTPVGWSAGVTDITQRFGEALTLAGPDRRLKLNKTGVGDNAEILFQQGASTRARLGLLGDNDLALQVYISGTPTTVVKSNIYGAGAQMLFPAGTAATPGISFLGQTGLGFSSPATNVVTLSLAGVEKMRWAQGAVGIGTSSAEAAVHIQYDGNNALLVKGADTNSIAMRLNNTALGGRNWALLTSGGGPAPAGTFGVYDDTIGALRFTISTTGVVKLHAYGAGTLSTDASGIISASSDERLKHIIADYVGGLATMREMDRPVIYNLLSEMTEGYAYDYIGFTAQGAARGIPEAAGWSPEDDMRTLDWRPISATHHNAILDLADQVAALQGRVAALAA